MWCSPVAHKQTKERKIKTRQNSKYLLYSSNDILYALIIPNSNNQKVSKVYIPVFSYLALDSATHMQYPNLFLLSLSSWPCRTHFC